MDSIKEIVRFATDRGIDKIEFCPENYQVNVVEELLELVGLDTPKENRPKLAELFQQFIGNVIDSDICTVFKVTEHTQIDAINDIEVLSITEQLKLVYEPNGTLSEKAKEVNSRTGNIISGKFEKNLSKEAKNKWYKADYSKYKIQPV